MKDIVTTDLPAKVKHITLGKVYLGYPMDNQWNNPRVVQWKNQAISELTCRGFTTIDPVSLLNFDEWLESLRGKGLRQASMEVVFQIRQKIQESDGVLLLLPYPSIGVACEMLFALQEQKPVVVWTTHQWAYHPFLNHFGKVFTELNSALNYLEGCILHKCACHYQKN